MRVGLHITPSLIRRRYDQGLDSIVRPVEDLKAQIEDFRSRHVAFPQRTIDAQKTEIKRLTQIIANKDAELVETHQLNRQLQMRIRELEKFIDAGSTAGEPPVKRDSHNSNQPPFLDLPWIKPKRTRTPRKQSGLKVG